MIKRKYIEKVGVVLGVLAISFSISFIVKGMVVQFGPADDAICYYHDSANLSAVTKNLCLTEGAMISKKENLVLGGVTVYSDSKYNDFLFYFLMMLLVPLIYIKRELIDRIKFFLLPSFKFSLFEMLLIMSLMFFCLFKTGIIDMLAFGQVIDALNFKVNVNIVSYYQGITGTLPLYPYNPLSLVLLQPLSELYQIFNNLGFPVHNYSFVQVFIFIIHILVCIQLSNLLYHENSKSSKKFIFYVSFLNPMAFYYVIFLGQLDILSLLFLLFSVSCVGRNMLWSAIWFSASVAILKIQHILFFIPMFLALFSYKEITIKEKIIWILQVSIGILIFYYIYLYSEGFYQALSNNPQSDRLSWSVLWTLFGGAININRPIALMLISFTVVVFITPDLIRSKNSFVCVVLLILGTIFSIFQYSYAHTFGMAILLLPAIIVVFLNSSKLQSFFIYFLSFFICISWGTGIVGDSSTFLGRDYFIVSGITDVKFMSIRYIDLINTLEFSSYLAFTLIFLIKLYRGAFDD